MRVDDADTDTDDPVVIADEDVRKFAESSLGRLLEEEAGRFGGFADSRRNGGGSAAAADAAPHPDSIAAVLAAMEREEEGEDNDDDDEDAEGEQTDAEMASPADDGGMGEGQWRTREPARKRLMSDLLRSFDPQNPPGPGASLHDVQLWMECDAQQEQVLRYQKVIDDARSRRDHASLTSVQRQILRWYPALRSRIEEEQKEYLRGREKKRSTHRRPKSFNKYGPFLCALQPEKLAVIAAHEAITRCLLAGGPVPARDLALKLGAAVEAEVHVQRLLRERMAEKAARNRAEKEAAAEIDNPVDGDGSEIVTTAAAGQVDGDGGKRTHIKSDDEDAGRNIHGDDAEIHLPNWTYSPAHLQSFVEELSGAPSGSSENAKVRITEANRRALRLLADPKPWHPDHGLQVGAALLMMLMEVATVEGDRGQGVDSSGGDGASIVDEPAFRTERKFIVPKRSKRQNRKQKKWWGSVGLVALHDRLVRMANEDTYHSVEGHTERYRPMVVPPRDWEGPNEGGYAALKVDLVRADRNGAQTRALSGADLSTVYGGLNALGRVPWRINKRVLEVAQRCWTDNVPLGDVPSRSNFDVPLMPEPPQRPGDAQAELGSDGEVAESEMTDEEQAAFKMAWRNYYIEMGRHRRFKQKNMDLNSLRCSALLKLGQAETFKEFEDIFFPYNVDFRGRAYPVPPHLSNIGSDLCRGLLTFAESKPLGERGFFWLRVHLANLAGADKMSFEDRAAFADDHMDDVRAAVDDPFGPNRWWMGLDDPFQGLAACHEICAAVDSGDPASYQCSLPVHMDGSCNGLQHYAALGRDRGGGKAVNLCVSDEPQDVYVGVMNEVIRRVKEESARDAPTFPDVNDPSDLTKAQREKINAHASASLVNGLIDRGVVKRTVMTSVYGVTFLGAKNQIREKVEEKLEERGDDIDEMEAEIHGACTYLARVTMDVMGDLFVGARSTMNWLATCARIIAAEGQPVAWITPIGIPSVQPYRQRKSYTVTTILQQVVLTNNSDNLPIHRQRQVSAFPPNYVHSLDSSHMILTALEMSRRGLTFSAVHDSFWTHAGDVDEMNVVLRDAFVDLHGRPLLEELKRTWELRYPELDFPDVPETGDLDLNELRDAPYFFQ